MKTRRWIFLTLLFVASTARAAEVAETETESPVASTGNPLDRAAAAIFQGDIPSLSYMDRHYAGLKSDPQGCRAMWREMRGTPVDAKPIRANFATIRANAKKWGISDHDLNRTLATFVKNQDQLWGQRYVTIIDMNKRANEKRFFMIDMKTGNIEAQYTSAGRGSDPDGDGYATEFSNTGESLKTSLGCYVAGGEYNRGRASMMLHGIEPSNDNACSRSIIMHPASYVGAARGRSHGCFALKENVLDDVFQKVNGGLICAYHDGKTRPTAQPAVRRKAKRRYHHRRHARRHFTYARGSANAY